MKGKIVWLHANKLGSLYPWVVDFIYEENNSTEVQVMHTHEGTRCPECDVALSDGNVLKRVLDHRNIWD